VRALIEGVVVRLDYMDVTTRRRVLALLTVALIVILLGVRHFARGGGQPSAQAQPTLAADAAAVSHSKIVVHVVGAVRRPGLYALRKEARIADAVRRAGGATRRADLEAINLAAPAEDGLQVVVPRRQPPAAASGAAAAPGDAPGSGPVHLNTATLEQLDTLPGVGPVTAQKILDWRQSHGAFTSVDDLDAVPGIGPARLEELRDLVAP
jgi:competence protein ComEA